MLIQLLIIEDYPLTALIHAAVDLLAIRAALAAKRPIASGTRTAKYGLISPQHT